MEVIRLIEIKENSREDKGRTGWNGHIKVNNANLVQCYSIKRSINIELTVKRSTLSLFLKLRNN